MTSLITAPEKSAAPRARIAIVVVVLAGALALVLIRAGSQALAQGSPESPYGAVGWGYNQYGQLGDLSQTASPLPVAVSGLEGVAAISAGDDYGLALMDDGTVMAWGDNRYGELGDGTTENRLHPVRVLGLDGVRAISAGAHHALALTDGGTVFAWGGNFHGQLGDGTTEDSDAPVEVQGLESVSAIAAGETQSMALRDDGSVSDWGYNGYGQLGIGEKSGPEICHSLPCSTRPLSVAGLGVVTAIAAGGDDALALLGDGTVSAWGWNVYGQLGNGSVNGSSLPVQVSGLANVSAIAAGSQHSVALLEDGTVFAWGWNTYGQLGVGTFTGPQTCAGEACSTVPLAVPGVAGAHAIAVGNQHSLALLGNGTLMDWGENEFGQLGDDTFTSSDEPVAVDDLTGVAGVSGGTFFNLAYGPPLPTIASLAPREGPLAGDNQITITGSNLGGTSGVAFGASPASRVAVDSASELTVTAPPGSGTVDVRVTTPAGTSAPGAGDLYSYAPAPTIAQVRPADGPARGGTRVKISGTNLGGASAVDFGSAPAASILVDTPTSIIAVTPPGTAGAAELRVATVGGDASAYLFHYRRPTISTVSPQGGPVSGGSLVSVSGSGFDQIPGTTSFLFGGVPASDVACSGKTTCTMLTPAHKRGTFAVRAIVAGRESVTTTAARFSFE